MKAVRIYGKEDLRLEEVPDPALEPGCVQLEGGYNGICGTDVHLYYAPESLPWDFDTPAALTGATWPQILGHEFSGVVAAIGAGVTSLAVGDRVAVFPYHSCGECPACAAGEYSCCHQMAFEGIQGRSGGLAEKRVVAAEQCFRLPDGLDLALGALVEPMAVGWHAVSQARPEPGDTALVVGGGPIGLGVYFALKAAGVENILVSEPSASRRDVLAGVGVADVVDPVNQDLGERVLAMTGGRGVQIAIDAAGVQAGFVQALTALGLRGRMVMVATYERPLQFDPALLAGMKSLRNSAVYTREDFGDVIAAMAAGVYTMAGGWVQIVAPEAVATAIETLRSGRGMKILVEV